MGDHGGRFGGIRSTKQGEVEDNNPALVVAIPEHLRKNNQLMSNLKVNAKALTTHYDTYATLMHIAKVSANNCDWHGTTLPTVQEGQRMSSNTKFEGQPDKDRQLLGQSYLCPFNQSTPRNCGNQLIPFDFCICQFRTYACIQESFLISVMF